MAKTAFIASILSVFLMSCHGRLDHVTPARVEIDTADAAVAQRLHARAGQHVCITGVLRVGGHDLFFPFVERQVERIYGDRVNVDIEPVQAVAMGLVDEQRHRFCGTLRDLNYVDANGESQNAFLLTEIVNRAQSR